MTIEELKERIARDEGETIEFKESTGQRGDACETLCAFLNRDGGTVVFGVSDTSRQFVRGERASGRSVDRNTERPSGGEGEGDGRGRFASDVSFLRRADGVPCGAERNSPDPLRSPLQGSGSVFQNMRDMVMERPFDGPRSCPTPAVRGVRDGWVFIVV